MKSALILVSLLALPAQAGKYTLAELVDKVSRQYPGVVSQRESVAAARANLLATRLQWLPAGDATLGFTGTPDVKCLDRLTDVNATGPGQTEPYADKALREANCVRTNVVDLRSSPLSQVLPFSGVYLSLNLALNQPLYSFGKLEAQIDGAKASVEAQEAAVLREQADVVWNVTRAYWGIKATRAAVDTLEEGLGKVKEWVERIDEELNGKNASRYTESDLARLKVAVTNAEILLLDQKRTQFYALEALRLLLEEPDADVDEGEIELDEPEVALDEWQGRMLRLRPELRIMDAQVKAAKTVRRLRIAELLPDLTLNSSLQYVYAPAVDTPQNYFLNRTNLLNVNFMLFLRQPLDFGPRAARYLQAKHDAAASALRMRASGVAYSTEIAKAFADWEEAKGRARQLKRGEKISRGWYNAVDQNMSAGLHTEGREIVEAAQNYYSFRLRQFQAIYDANVQLAQLRRSSGVTEVGATSRSAK